MLNFSQARIARISIHYVGNKPAGGKLQLSNAPFSLHEEWLEDILKKYFLNPFKEPYFYHFDGEKNAAQDCVNRIFDSVTNFHKESQQLASLLFDSATHPKIKEGEFYVVMFEDCIIEDEVVNAVGLFKSENKDTFLKVFVRNEEAEINAEEGINIHKLDKGCIVFNTERDKGYKICMVDNTNKLQEAQYWKSDFLGLKHSDSSYYSTMQYMEMVKHFSEDFLSPQNHVPKEEQLQFLKKTADYFQEKETFDVSEFKQEVIIEPEMMNAFDEYLTAFSEERDVPVMDKFQISTAAVNKSSNKFFRSVIKLDKNFHLYVHGNADFIERGFDKERGLNYYKLYFREES